MRGRACLCASGFRAGEKKKAGIREMDLLLPIVLVILVAAVAVYWYFGRRKPGSAGNRIDPGLTRIKISKKEEDKGDAPEGTAKEEAAGEGAESAKGGETSAAPEAAPVRPAESAGAIEEIAPRSECFTERPDIDQMTEVVVRLTCKTPFSDKQAQLARQPLLSQDFGVPLRIQVRNQFTGLWGPVQRGGTYTDMIVTLQLATRARAVDELSAGNFAAAVNQAVLALDADADVIDVPSVVAQAKAVKALIDRYGMRLSIGVKSPVPVTGQMAMELAQKCGFSIRDKHVEKRDPDSASAWLRMMPHPGRGDLVLLELTPALCTPSRNPLGSLFSAANDLAARLGGEITDASGAPIGAREAVAITRQMRFFYAAMAKQGLDPGTLRAKRLFA